MPAISFEFFPPKTDEQRAQLDRTAARLKSLAPEYVSCTFGAGGSTLSYTPETIQRLRRAVELRALFIGLGRKEFEADRRHRRGFRQAVRASIYLCVAMER